MKDKYYWRIRDLVTGEIVCHEFPYKTYRQCLYAVKRFINYRSDRDLKRICAIHITSKPTDRNFVIDNSWARLYWKRYDT